MDGHSQPVTICSVSDCAIEAQGRTSDLIHGKDPRERAEFIKHFHAKPPHFDSHFRVHPAPLS